MSRFLKKPEPVLEPVDPDLINNIINKVDSVLNQDINVSRRIKLPLVWARFPSGIRVQDLHEDRYNECLAHIKKVYMADETICASLELLNDEESSEQFGKIILSRMHDTQSLVAIKEDENRIVGCLIERVVDTVITKTMSRMGIYEGETLCKIQRLRKHILKTVNFNDIYGTYRCNDIYVWCVEEEYRCQGIGKALLDAAIRQTELFHSTILCGIFTSELSQTIARKVGFESVFELPYAGWVEGTEVVIENPGPGNYTAAFMVIYFEPEPLEFEGECDEEECGEEWEEECEEECEEEEAASSVTLRKSTTHKSSEKGLSGKQGE